MVARDREARLHAMTTPSGHTIASLDLQTATDAEIREISQFRQELALEQRPEDPPTPIEVIAQWLRSRPPGQWRMPCRCW